MKRWLFVALALAACRDSEPSKKTETCADCVAAAGSAELSVEAVAETLERPDTGLQPAIQPEITREIT